MFTKFYWKGVFIPDIHAWAKERNEPIISYRAYRLVPGLASGKLEYEEKFGEMPWSFWTHLTMADGWNYEEV